MKTLITTRFWLVLFGIALAGLITTEGCKTAYKATSASYIAVDTAMKVWGDYVAQKHPSQAQELAVKAAYEKYQASVVVITDLGISVANAQAAGQPTADLQKQLTAALANSSQLIVDLETTIRSFGVKL